MTLSKTTSLYVSLPRVSVSDAITYLKTDGLDGSVIVVTVKHSSQSREYDSSSNKGVLLKWGCSVKRLRGTHETRVEI